MENKMNTELITLRKEIKYVVPMEKALAIKSHLDNLLQRDAYCVDGAYSVRSLYFESVDNADFSEKIAGVNVRKKVRARMYNEDASLCKLELKQKYGDLQRKESFTISADDVSELSCGKIGALRKYFQDSKISLKAYTIMSQGCYRPVVQIEYDRFAYKYPMFDTRITLDMNIRASETNMDIFSSDINYTFLMPEKVVLEVKYNEKIMGFISDMLSQFSLTQESYSKYCSGRKAYCDFIY